MTHYETLGVTKNATDTEIKSAYRKLVMKYHPDRPTGDEERFKKIQIAYETLSDPKKKEMYDLGAGEQHTFRSHSFQEGPHAFHFNFDGENIDLNDILQQHFSRGGHGFHFHRGRPQRNQDYTLEVTLSLAETLDNQSKIVQLSLADGTTETINVEIPRGIRGGMHIKYPGKGDNQHKNFPRGDLIVQFNVLNPGGYWLDHRGLHTAIDVNIFDALIGGEIEFTNFDAKTFNVKLQPGINQGTQIKLKGQGIYNLSGTQREDLYLHANLKVPAITDEKTIELIKQLKKNQ